jgi:hypothetical protein
VLFRSPTATANAAATRTELATELARLDEAISTRSTLAAGAAMTLTGDYDAAKTAAPTATANAAATRTELATELARLDEAISTRSKPADVVDANIVKINDKTIQGSGVAGDSFKPV